MYKSTSLSTAHRKEIIVVYDASTRAVGTVAYLKITNADGLSEVGFLFGRAKLAPKPDVTVPRLELCAAVLAVEVAEMLQEQLDTILDDGRFYTDSNVVLGYIFNETRQFLHLRSQTSTAHYTLNAATSVELCAYSH